MPRLQEGEAGLEPPVGMPAAAWDAMQRIAAKVLAAGLDASTAAEAARVVLVAFDTDLSRTCIAEAAVAAAQRAEALAPVPAD